MKKPVLKVSRELWDELTKKQQDKQRAKFDVVVAPSYYANGEVK